MKNESHWVDIHNFRSKNLSYNCIYEVCHICAKSEQRPSEFSPYKKLQWFYVLFLILDFLL